MNKRIVAISIALMFIVGFISLAASVVERGDRLFIDKVTMAKTLTLNAVPRSTVGNGAATTGCTAVEYGDGIVHKTVLTLNKSVTITDATTSGAWGAYKMYDFPGGAIEILGIAVDLDGLAGAGGLADAADGDFAIGSATCNAGTLTSTEADFIASTAIAQFAAGTGPITGQNAAVLYADGTTTAKDLWLNVIFDDADSSASDTLAVTGTVTVIWINRGDY